jgi:hypothetical protein
MEFGLAQRFLARPGDVRAGQAAAFSPDDIFSTTLQPPYSLLKMAGPREGGGAAVRTRLVSAIVPGLGMLLDLSETCADGTALLRKRLLANRGQLCSSAT